MENAVKPARAWLFAVILLLQVSLCETGILLCVPPVQYGLPQPFSIQFTVPLSGIQPEPATDSSCPQDDLRQSWCEPRYVNSV
jgi:hypothetical protein